MWDRDRLAGLDDQGLLTALSALVARYNRLTSELVAHLAEVDARRLYLELGFPSLFEYCIKALGFSESAAGRRIAAARVCRRFPEAFERVESGALHLSALSALAPHLREENATELLEECSNRSRRQVDELLAARFPRADLPERVRVLSLSADRFGLEFTVDREALEELERVRGLARHRHPSGDLGELFKLAMRSLRQDLEKQRFGVGRKPRASQARVPEARGAAPRQEGAMDRAQE